MPFEPSLNLWGQCAAQRRQFPRPIPPVGQRVPRVRQVIGCDIGPARVPFLAQQNRPAHGGGIGGRIDQMEKPFGRIMPHPGRIGGPPQIRLVVAFKGQHDICCRHVALGHRRAGVDDDEGLRVFGPCGRAALKIVGQTCIVVPSFVEKDPVHAVPLLIARDLGLDLSQGALTVTGVDVAQHSHSPRLSRLDLSDIIGPDSITGAAVRVEDRHPHARGGGSQLRPEHPWTEVGGNCHPLALRPGGTRR